MSLLWTLFILSYVFFGAVIVFANVIGYTRDEEGKAQIEDAKEKGVFYRFCAAWIAFALLTTLLWPLVTAFGIAKWMLEEDEAAA